MKTILIETCGTPIHVDIPEPKRILLPGGHTIDFLWNHSRPRHCDFDQRRCRR